MCHRTLPRFSEACHFGVGWKWRQKLKMFKRNDTLQFLIVCVSNPLEMYANSSSKPGFPVQNKIPLSAMSLKTDSLKGPLKHDKFSFLENALIWLLFWQTQDFGFPVLFTFSNMYS